MASADKELERQIKEAGTKLADPPLSAGELLPLLDELDSYLGRVEQSPTESMQDALVPPINALIADHLFRHSDVDVKVAVASCISEITRITAPDAPYDDERMKDVFHLIVASFENFDDMTSRSYVKRTSILETVAKVRSCVVMLDLECDALIVEMFKKFLKSIRDYHPEIVVSSMETVLILVLEESEDIPTELLSPLLTCIRKDNEEVLPIARKLAEKVLERCASKIKPYLVEALKSLQTSVDDYSGIIGSICKDVCVDDIEPGEKTKVEGSKTDRELIGGAPKANQEVIAAVDPSEVAAAAGEKSSKSVVSNGAAKMTKAKSRAGSSSVKKQEGDAIEEAKDASAAENAAVEKPTKKEIRPVQRAKKRGRKTNSSAKVAKRSVQAADEKEAEKLPEVKSLSKDAPGSPNVNQAVSDAAVVASENKRKNDNQAADGESLTASPSVSESLESQKVAAMKKKEGSSKEAVMGSPHASQPLPDDIAVASENKRKNDNQAVDGKSLAASPSGSESLEDECLSKKLARLKKKDGSVKELVQSADDLCKNASEATSAPEAKSNKRAGKKVPSGASKLDKSIKTDGLSKKECGAESEDDENAPKQSSMVDEGSKHAEGSSLKQSEDKKRARGKAVSEKNMAKSSAKNDNNENISSLKSTIKSARDENPVEETPKTSNKRKRVVGKSAEKGTASERKVYGEDIVGLRVRVWWPQDRTFYEGTVESYDSTKKRHKVLYDDNEEENLNMAKQKFEFIADESKSEAEGEASKPSSPDAASEMPEKKKAKSDQPTKQEKVDGSPVRSGGGAASKAKAVAGEKSGRKSKEPAASKTDGKSAAEDSKSSKKKVVDNVKNKSGGNKPGDAVEPSKTPGKSGESDDDAAITKSKEDGAKSLKGKQQGGAKSSKLMAACSSAKRKTPKSANGIGKSKAGPGKAKETVEAKESDSGKEEEDEEKEEEEEEETNKVKSAGKGSGAKRGRKRRRGAA